MDKKKKLIQLTEGMLLCCVIVVMTLLCIGIIKKEVKNTKGKLTETTGWYRIQDNKKVQVDLNQKIKADPQGKLVMGFHVQQEIVGIVMIAIMFFLSFVALITGIYLKHFKLNSARFLNIAAFLALSRIWFLSDSALAQEYTSFPALTGMVSFYAFMLMSVPMVHFVKNTLDFEKYKILDMIDLLFYANALIEGILNKCLKIHMVQMLFVTHVLLFVAVITIVVLMIKEYRRTKDSELKIIMNAFGIMAVAGVLSLCMYWKPEVPFYGTIFEMGVLIFELLLLISIFVNLVEQAKTRSELEVYERLLKEDRMTGINNRTAFEEQLQDIEDHAQDYDNAALIFMDVDGLKHTNDLYGHNAGDELIISAAQCIKMYLQHMENVTGSAGMNFVCLFLIQ